MHGEWILPPAQPASCSRLLFFNKFIFTSALHPKPEGATCRAIVIGNPLRLDFVTRRIQRFVWPSYCVFRCMTVSQKWCRLQVENTVMVSSLSELWGVCRELQDYTAGIWSNGFHPSCHVDPSVRRIRIALILRFQTVTSLHTSSPRLLNYLISVCYPTRTYSRENGLKIMNLLPEIYTRVCWKTWIE
jgi:hypothetical protein